MSKKDRKTRGVDISGGSVNAERDIFGGDKNDIRSQVANNGSIINNYNQMGGQVAHQIFNIGPQERHLTPEVTAQLDTIVTEHTGKTIQVHCIQGDSEAFAFASEVRQYLLSRGSTVSAIGTIFSQEIIRGQTFNERLLTLTIGKNG